MSKTLTSVEKSLEGEAKKSLDKALGRREERDKRLRGEVEAALARKDWLAKFQSNWSSNGPL